MIVIVLSTWIDACLQKCFDLARDVDDHVESMQSSGERVVGGRSSGLLELGDKMTLEARHFGIRFRMTAKITEFDASSRFVDEMVEGPFKSLWHEHLFEERNGGTQITDTMRIEAPFGVIGRIAEKLFLKRKMQGIIAVRQAHIKRTLEE